MEAKSHLPSLLYPLPFGPIPLPIKLRLACLHCLHSIRKGMEAFNFKAWWLVI